MSKLNVATYSDDKAAGKVRIIAIEDKIFYARIQYDVDTGIQVLPHLTEFSRERIAADIAQTEKDLLELRAMQADIEPVAAAVEKAFPGVLKDIL